MGNKSIQNTSSFSFAAEKTLQAIQQASNGEPAILEFGQRVARAITHYDAGLTANSPVGTFLFHVPPGISLYDLWEGAAEAWFEGKTWDGSPAFFRIDCGGFTGPDPRVLAPLIGGAITEYAGQRYAIPSLLAQIDNPHFGIRAQEFLRTLANWRDWFLEEHAADVVAQLRPEQKEALHEKLAQIVDTEQNRRYEKLKKEGPFRSIVVFEGVNRFAHPGLLGIIQTIMQQGSMTVWPNRVVDFSHALVIIVVYDDLAESARDTVGFHKEQASRTRAPSEEHALHVSRRGRKNLIAIPQLTGLVESMGDNIFVLDTKSLDAQQAHTHSQLQEIKRRLAQCNLHIEWSQEFVQGIVEDTKDEEFKSYTDGRLKNAIEKHLVHPIAQLVLAGCLHSGTTLCFQADTDKEGAFRGSCSVTKEGTGNLVTPSQIQDAWKNKKVGAQYFNERLLEAEDAAYEFLQRIHRKADELL